MMNSLLGWVFVVIQVLIGYNLVLPFLLYILYLAKRKRIDKYPRLILPKEITPSVPPTSNWIQCRLRWSQYLLLTTKTILFI